MSMKSPDDYEDLHVAAELCVKYGIFTDYDREDYTTSFTDEFRNYMYICGMEKLNLPELFVQLAIMEAYRACEELYKDDVFENKGDLLLSLSLVAIHLARNEYFDKTSGDELISMGTVVECFMKDLLEGEQSEM